jgi:hypothetical protein
MVEEGNANRVRRSIMVLILNSSSNRSRSGIVASSGHINRMQQIRSSDILILPGLADRKRMPSFTSLCFG